MKPQKTPEIQSNLEQMNDVGEITTPDFNIYCRDRVIKNNMVLVHYTPPHKRLATNGLNTSM